MPRLSEDDKLNKLITVIPTAVEESLTPDERDPSATYARDDKNVCQKKITELYRWEGLL